MNGKWNSRLLIVILGITLQTTSNEAPQINMSKKMIDYGLTLYIEVVLAGKMYRKLKFYRKMSAIPI